MEEDESSCVKVVIHARPLLKTDGPEAKSAVDVCPRQKQVTVTTNAKSYFYDHVFDGTRSSISDIYTKAVSPLVDTLFKGYNATVAAYGQTGSGKTFTMGSEGQEGLIADANAAIFARLTRCRHQVMVRVSFVEVYKEKIFDLLQYASKPATAAGSSAAAASPAAATKTGTPVGTSSVRSSRLPSAPAPATPAAPKGRHGQAPALLPLGGKSDTISLDIASQHVVTRPSEVMELLRCGAAMRRTADNGKNARSSRSHAIFSITVEQRPRPSGAAAGGGSPSSPGAARAGAAAAGQGGEPAGLDASSISLGFDDVGCRDSGLGGDGSGEGASCGGSGAGAVEEPSLGLAELLNSRIHFVDLAGSETISEGGDKGETRTINQSLLTFQRVLRVLAERKPDAHVPYRESMLTRLLQEALGGNSRTLMIACISPAWATRMQTSSTLEYAKYASRIRNQPRINRKSLAEVNEELADQVAWLQRENRELRAHLAAVREAQQGAAAAAAGGGDADSASDVWSDAGGGGGGYKRLYEDEAEKLLRVSEVLEGREHELAECQVQAAEAAAQLAAARRDAGQAQAAAAQLQQQVLEMRGVLAAQLAASQPRLQQQRAAWAAAAARLQQEHGVQLEVPGPDLDKALGSYWSQQCGAGAMAADAAQEAPEVLCRVQDLVGCLLGRLSAGEAARAADVVTLQHALQQQVAQTAAQQQEAAKGEIAALRQQHAADRQAQQQELEEVWQQLAAAQAALEEQHQAAQADLRQAAQQQQQELQEQEARHAAALEAARQEQEAAVVLLQQEHQDVLASQQEAAAAQLQQAQQQAQLEKERVELLQYGLHEAAAAAEHAAATHAAVQQELQQQVTALGQQLEAGAAQQQQLEQQLQAQGAQLQDARDACRRLQQQLGQRAAAAGATEAQLQAALAAGVTLQQLCQQLASALARHAAQQKVAVSEVGHLRRRVTDHWRQKLEEGLGLVQALNQECTECTHLLERTGSDGSSHNSVTSDAKGGANAGGGDGAGGGGVAAAEVQDQAPSSDGGSLLCDSSSGTCSEEDWCGEEEGGAVDRLEEPSAAPRQHQQQPALVQPPAPSGAVPSCHSPRASGFSSGTQGLLATGSTSSPCKPEVAQLCSQVAVQQRVEQLQAVIQQQQQEQQQQGTPPQGGRALDGMKAQYPILPSRHPRGLACTPAKQLKQQLEGLPASPGAKAAGVALGGGPASPAAAAEGDAGAGTRQAGRRRWGPGQQQEPAAGDMDSTGPTAAAGAAAAARVAGHRAASPLPPASPLDCPLDAVAAGSAAAFHRARSAAASPVDSDDHRVTPGVATATSPAATPAPHSTPRDGLPPAAGHPDMSPASLWSRVTKIVGSLGKTKGRQGTPQQQQQQQETPGSGPEHAAGPRSTGSKTKSRIGALRAGPSYGVSADAAARYAAAAAAAAAATAQQQGLGAGRDPVVQHLFNEDRGGDGGEHTAAGVGSTAAAGVGASSRITRPGRSQGIPLASAADDDTRPLDRRSVRSDQSGASSTFTGSTIVPPVYCWPLVYEEGLTSEQERAVLALVGSTSGAHLRAWLKGKQLGGVVWVARGKRRHELVQDVLAYDAAQQQRQQQLVRVSDAEGGSSRGPSRAGGAPGGSGANSRSSSRNSMVRPAAPPLAAAAGVGKAYTAGSSSILQHQQKQGSYPVEVVDPSGRDVQVRGGDDAMAPAPEQRRTLWQQDPALHSKGTAEAPAAAAPLSAAAAAGGGGSAARMQMYKEAARRALGASQEAAGSSGHSSGAYPAVPAPAPAAGAGGGVSGRGPAMQVPAGYGGELGRPAPPLHVTPGHPRSTQPSPVLTSPTTRAADVAAAAARYKAGRAGPVQAPPPALAAAAAGGAGAGLGGVYGGLPPPVLITQAKLQAQARR